MIKGKPKQLTVSIQVSRYSGGSEGGGIHLEIIDEASRLHVASIEISGDANIANLFTQRQCDGIAKIPVGCAGTWGMRHECKTVTVPCDEFGNGCASASVDKAEADNPGWKADADERKYNHHRRDDKGYSVVLRRWVA